MVAGARVNFRMEALEMRIEASGDIQKLFDSACAALAIRFRQAWEIAIGAKIGMIGCQNKTGRLGRFDRTISTSGLPVMPGMAWSVT